MAVGRAWGAVCTLLLGQRAYELFSTKVHLITEALTAEPVMDNLQWHKISDEVAAAWVSQALAAVC